MDTLTPQNSGISSQRAILSISIPDFFLGDAPSTVSVSVLTWKPFFQICLQKRKGRFPRRQKEQPCSMIQDSPCCFFRILQICRGIRQLFNVGFWWFEAFFGWLCKDNFLQDCHISPPKNDTFSILVGYVSFLEGSALLGTSKIQVSW